MLVGGSGGCGRLEETERAVDKVFFRREGGEFIIAAEPVEIVGVGEPLIGGASQRFPFTASTVAVAVVLPLGGGVTACYKCAGIEYQQKRSDKKFVVAQGFHKM